MPASTSVVPAEPSRELAKDELAWPTDTIAGYVRGAGAALAGSARAVSSVRLLAYASEAGVSTQDVIPRSAYLATWVLSGAYVVADVYVKVQQAPVRACV